jgi:hypothetical protein
MTKHRSGTGGITPPPATTDQARATMLLAVGNGIGHVYTGAPDGIREWTPTPDEMAAIRRLARPVLDVLGLLPDPAKTPRSKVQPGPTVPPTDAAIKLAARVIPDRLDPQRAATLARLYERHGLPVPLRVAKLRAEYQAERRAARRAV